MGYMDMTKYIRLTTERESTLPGLTSALDNYMRETLVLYGIFRFFRKWAWRILQRWNDCWNFLSGQPAAWAYSSPLRFLSGLDFTTASGRRQGTVGFIRGGEVRLEYTP